MSRIRHWRVGKADNILLIRMSRIRYWRVGKADNKKDQLKRVGKKFSLGIFEQVSVYLFIASYSYLSHPS